MTARYYSAKNGSLPTIDSKKLGDIIVAIKAALITGYNGTQSAGWDLVYESISNNGDASHRIAVRSNAVSSEQRVFEIVDIDTNAGVINCWESWVGDAGSKLLLSRGINKRAIYDNATDIVANESFVHMSINSAYHAFGDIDVFDTVRDKTVILGISAASSDDVYLQIASTNNPSKNKFVGVDGKNYLCRSFCKEYTAYGAMVDDNQNYAGGDKVLTSGQIIGILTSVRRTELLELDGVCYREFGFLPMSAYTDNPRTMQNQQLMIDNRVQKVVLLDAVGSWYLLCLVDV